MKRLALIAAVSASPAFAETVDVFVVQEDGSGVVQYESPLSVEEAAVLIDGNRPPGANRVILEQDERPIWTTESPQTINEDHGGDGEPYIERRADADPDSEIEFDAEEEERLRRDDDNGDDNGDDMEFDEEEERRRQAEENEPPSDIDFEDTEDLLPEPDSMQSSKIQPRDGYWAIEILEQTFSGCSGAIEDAVRSQMAAMNMSGASGNYGPDFTPEQMAPQLDWTQTGTNSWFGSLDMSGEASGVFMQWGVQVISPTVINNRQHLTFAIGGLGSCEVNTFVLTYWAFDS